MSNENKNAPELLEEERSAALTDDRPAAETAESAPKKKKKKSAEEGGAKTASSGKSGGKKSSSKSKAKKAAELAAAETEKEKKRQERKKKRARTVRGWLIAMIVIVSLALIVSVAAVVGAYLVTNSTTNLPNVYLGDVYVGGMTKEETVRALKEAKWENTEDGVLTVKLPEGVSFDVEYLKAGACMAPEEASELAFRYGHSGDWFANLYTYVNDLLSTKDLGDFEFTIHRDYVASLVDKAVDEFETVTEGEEYVINEEALVLEAVKGAGQVTLDRAAITDRVCELLLSREQELVWDEIVGEPKKPDFKAVAAALSRDPVDAKYDPEKDEIIDEVKGVSFDAEVAEKLWEKAGVLEKIRVPIDLIEPEVTAKDLKDMLFRDKLGDCMTYLWGSTANRISNIRLACSRFDGLVLQPGEQFSYNTVVGERTAEAGFKMAPTYNGTQHVDGLGGGICQVSSTLYNAVLYANLEVNERSSHSMIVAYLPLGLDATVDWPSTDFVFTNTRDYPIKIKAGVDEKGRQLTVEIWGTDVDGSYVDMLHYEWPIYDDTYLEKYGLQVKIGDGARTIRRTYHADGTFTDEPNVYSTYHLPDEEIRWPAVPKDPEPESETETETETETVTETETETVDGGTEVVIDDGGTDSGEDSGGEG